MTCPSELDELMRYAWEYGLVVLLDNGRLRAVEDPR